MIRRLRGEDPAHRMAKSALILLAMAAGTSAFAPPSSAPPLILQSRHACSPWERGLRHAAPWHSAKSPLLLLRPVTTTPTSCVRSKAGSADGKGEGAREEEEEEENTLAGSVLASGGGLPLSPDQKKAKAKLGDVGVHIPSHGLSLFLIDTVHIVLIWGALASNLSCHDTCASSSGSATHGGPPTPLLANLSEDSPTMQEPSAAPSTSDPLPLGPHPRRG